MSETVGPKRVCVREREENGEARERSVRENKREREMQRAHRRKKHHPEEGHMREREREREARREPEKKRERLTCARAFSVFCSIASVNLCCISACSAASIFASFSWACGEGERG